LILLKIKYDFILNLFLDRSSLTEEKKK